MQNVSLEAKDIDELANNGLGDLCNTSHLKSDTDAFFSSNANPMLFFGPTQYNRRDAWDLRQGGKTYLNWQTIKFADFDYHFFFHQSFSAR